MDMLAFSSASITREGKPDRLLTYVDAAAILRVRPQTIRAWVCRGSDIPFRRFGGQRRVWESELVAWIEQRDARAAG